MPIRIEDIRTQLKKYRSNDDVILSAVESARELLRDSTVAGKSAGIDLMVCNFSGTDEQFHNSLLFTESCKVIITVPLIIFNEQFLKELEAVIRSFALSQSLLQTQYFQSDAHMFGLIQRISNHTDHYLKQLRALVEEKTDDATAVAEELMMMIFYFISHEIGHLLGDKDQHHYATFLDKDAPLEDRIANAVVKMGMHMDDLSEYGFTFGKGLRADKQYSDIKRVADTLRTTVEQAIANHLTWFQNEKEADAQANEVVIEYLTKLGSIDEQLADRRLHRFVRGLFAASIYSWFKDLGAFLDKLDCGRTNSAQSLMLEMMKNRERYIQAASLFGDVHRFTLLRANLAIEAVLRAMCLWFEENIETRSIWYSRVPVPAPRDFSEMKKWRLAENLQRCSMLRILMDTAVKISFIGFSTGWFKEMDIERGTPQLLTMTFYSIPYELELLKRLR